MFFSIKYKENEEKYIKLFGNIKEKCYFCSRVEILASRNSKSEHCLLLNIMRCREELGKI